MERPRAACHEAVFAPLTQSGMYKRLLREIRGSTQTLPLFGMPENGKAPLLAALYEQTQRSMLVVCASDFAAQKLYAALEGTLGDAVHLLPMRTVHLSKSRVQDKQNQGLRAAALDALSGDTPGVVIASVDAARARLLPVQTFASNGFTLQTGEQLDLLDLAEALERAGYARVETVDAYGQFAVRGGIVDVFLPNADAYRIDFFGDEIDSIRLLDPLSQRSSDAVKQCRICPAIEMPLNARQAKHALDAINRAHRGAQGETLVRLNNLYLSQLAVHWLEALRIIWSFSYETLPFSIFLFSECAFIIPIVPIVVNQHIFLIFQDFFCFAAPFSFCLCRYSVGEKSVFFLKSVLK